MKNKKAVNFDENQEDKNIVRNNNSVTKNNVSASKCIRDGSTNKMQKNMMNAPRPSGERVNSSQKIRILLRKDGFIFQKKYLIYDIQCSLVKKSQDKQDQLNKNETLQKGQDFIFLNLQTSSCGIVRGLVRHNFPIERDHASFIQIRTFGYVLQSMLIHNKRIQFVQLDGTQNIEDQELTIIEPIKLIQQGQSIRANKLLNYTNSKSEKRIRKHFNFCWSIQNVQNIQMAPPTTTRTSLRKNQPQWALIFNTVTNNVNSMTQREMSTNKGNTSVQDNLLFRDSMKLNKNMIGQKLNFMELMKCKEGKGLTKTSSRKYLNESGVSCNGGTSKKTGKENHEKQKQDVYGLQQICIKKPKTRMPTQQQLHENQIKMMEIERYGLAKKNY